VTAAATAAMVRSAEGPGKERQPYEESLLAVPGYGPDTRRERGRQRYPELAAYNARPKDPVGGAAGREFVAAVAVAQAEPNVNQKEVEGLCARSSDQDRTFEREQRPLLSHRAEQAASAFIRGGWPFSPGAKVRLHNFIEDIIGSIVGDSYVEPFLELCVAKRLAA
jgi:hypothetical protein